MKNSYRAIIVEDDESSLSSLQILLKKHFSNIVLSGSATTLKSAKDLLVKVKPDLVFLDIDLPDGNGFQLLENQQLDFEVIFTTSFNEFAVRAFEFSAVHYLIKPLDSDNLITAVNRFMNLSLNNNFEEKFKILKEGLTDYPQKIMLPSSDGHNVYNINDIVLCEADSNYTTLYFNTGEKVVVSKQLHTLEDILKSLSFVRAHSKYLINLRYLKKYKKSKHSEITLTNGLEIPVSQHYRAAFEEKMMLFVRKL